MEKIAILHTNDIHSHFENWPKIKRYLIDEKRKLEEKGYFVLTVDLGDALDRSHPLTEATDGRANIELLNQIGYDAATIGNNEGLTNSHEQLNHLYDDANFDVILANILDAETLQLPSWGKEKKTIKTPQGNIIDIFGLTAPYQSTYKLVGWKPIDDQVKIEELLDKNTNDSVKVLLSHLGVTQDRLIAQKFPQFNVIIGSHTHHLFEHGENDNQSLLAAAGKYGFYVGEILLEVDNNKVLSKSASVVEVASLPELDGDEEFINGLEDKGEKLLSESKVAMIDHDIDNGLRGKPEIVSLFLDAMKKKAHTKASVVNNGLFLSPLKKGVINKNDLHQILPHSMHVAKTSLVGADIWRLVMEMQKNWKFLIQFPQKGMGFRGKFFGQLNYDGIEVDENNNVYFDGELVDFNKTYEIALLDHYIFIPFFPTVAIKGQNNILYDQTLRDLFADYLSDKFPLE